MPLDPSTIELAVGVVRRDIVDGYRTGLSPRGTEVTIELTGSGLEERDSYAIADELVAVPWSYQCTHIGTFLDIPATALDLELRGVTFVHVIGATQTDWQLHRYVDYLGALHQLGVSASVRPALDPQEYAQWVQSV